MPRDLNETVKEMVQAFEDHSNDQGFVSDEGLFKLGQIFGDVDVNDRADVFVAFVAILEAKGVDFDIEQFMTDPDEEPTLH